MTSTAATIARTAPGAAAARNDSLTADDLEALRSDDGLIVDGAVVWLTDRDTVLAWAGNDLDEGMNFPAEVPMGAR